MVVTSEVEESRLTSHDCPLAMRDSSAMANPARWSHSSLGCGWETLFAKLGLRDAIGERPPACLVCCESKADVDFALPIGELGSCWPGK